MTALDRDPAEPQQLSIATAHFPHAPSPRRVAASRNVKLALPTFHSAPTSTGHVIERKGALKMHHSFAAMDAPGDTQPDSQMHKEWTSGIYGTVDVVTKIPSPKSLFTEHVDPEDDEGDVLSDGAEVVESSQERHSPTVTSPTVLHDDDLFGALQMQYAAPTSPLKFETPAVAGKIRIRDSSGGLLSSAIRTNTTPGTVVSASAFPGFGNGAIAPMSLTQAWHNTQAPTSPVAADAAEDLAFTRPSPNFNHARHSSPIPALSSPIKALPPETPRTDPIIRSSSEPRTEYVSMKESQERRRRTMQEEQVPSLEQEDSWDRPSAAQLRLMRKKAKADLERKAAKAFANVSAPTPPSHYAGRKRMPRSKLGSPTKSCASRRQGQDDSENIGHLEEAEEPNVVGEESDSQDELSQDGPSTARTVVNHNLDNTVLVPKTSSHPHRTQNGLSPSKSPQDASPTSRLQREPQLHAPGSQSLLRGSFRPPSSKDSVAIMDSQPDATADYDSIPRPKALRFPSSPSINQYSIHQTTIISKTGYTSQVVSSSMPPMPPEEAEDEPEDNMNGEERVPSSPPVLAHEDDITYDEHEQAYDEYAEGDDVRASIEPQTTNDELATDDEDDLPSTEQEKAEDANQDEQDIVEGKGLCEMLHEINDETYEEVPETLDPEPEEIPHDATESQLPGGETLDERHATPVTPRTQRQNTVPETDALEETQPSLFKTNDPGFLTTYQANQATDNLDTSNQTDSAELFHTAQEQATPSQSRRTIPASSKDEGSDTIPMGERLRSLQDIHNLPNTQQSVAEEEIEMPRLSGLDEHEEAAFMTVSPPAPPSAKRRRITYTAKRNVFRSPGKVENVVEPAKPPSPDPINDSEPPENDVPLGTSTQDREEHGAVAATLARNEAENGYSRAATLKVKVPPRKPRKHTNKKGSLKPISKELLQSISSPGNSPNKSKTTNHASAPVTPRRRSTVRKSAQDDVEMPDADDERDELADTTPEPIAESVVRRTLDLGETPTGAIFVPNRVLASWPGSHFYPATCLGRTPGHQIQIRFDDGNITALDPVQVRALDIRPGDHVKVDEPGMKKHTYVVVGLKDRIDDLAGEEFPVTDRHGYKTVVLEEKQRDSLPAAKAKRPIEHISVPLGSIYITTQLWTKFRDRTFNLSPPTSPSKPGSGIDTPVAAMDAVITPSFARRSVTVPSLLKNVTARAGSVASSTRSGSGVFSQMAFVLTSTATDVDKDSLTKAIKSNGGLVLEHGFHELFDLDTNETPSSPHSHVAGGESDGPAGLSLKHQYQDLGFVALISDSHSRSTKYIQALALNVPCLHLRWIQDSLSTSRAVPFNKYLLPAGVSKFLDPLGVIRSRTMKTYDPSSEDISFSQTLAHRDLLLHDQSVLLVTGKSKKEIEKRQPFVFLSHALGSAHVRRCTDLPAAAKLLAKSRWDWIYVDNGESGVAEAASQLFGSPKPLPASGRQKKSKKRKRDDADARKEELVARGQVADRQVKITCAEFVIQSLILGALVEE